MNGPEAIQSDEMYPIFKLVQDLYSLAYAKSVDMPYSSSYGVVCKEVPIYHKKYKSGVLSFCKIKIDTDLRLAMTAGIRKVFVEEPSAFDPRKYLVPARDLIKETVKHKMENVFGSSEKI